jgi:hypothetical protein
MKRRKARDKNDGRENRNEEDDRMTAPRIRRSSHGGQKSLAQREDTGKNAAGVGVV